MLNGQVPTTLQPDPMRRPDSSSHGTPFTLSVEARRGVTTGISAYDRAHTVRVLIDPRSRPSDVAVPGHMFPLRARPGGVLVRAGHNEATIELPLPTALGDSCLTVNGVPVPMLYSSGNQINGQMPVDVEGSA